MTFPVCESVTVSSEGASVTAHDVSFASTSLNDIVVAIVIQDGNSGGYSWPAGWTEVIDAAIGANVASITVGWRRCSAGETTVQVTSTNAERSTHLAYRISGGHTTSAPEFSATATGSSTTPNPDSLTASWGAEDNLWGAYYGIDTGAPTAYPLPDCNTSTGTTPTSAAYGGACSDQLNQATLDPGTFTTSLSDDWRAGTFVVRPAAAAAIDLNLEPVATSTAVPVPSAQQNLGPSPVAAVTAVPTPAMQLNLAPSPVVAPTAVPVPSFVQNLGPVPVAAATAVPAPSIEMNLGPDPVAAVTAVPLIDITIGTIITLTLDPVPAITAVPAFSITVDSVTFPSGNDWYVVWRNSPWGER